jgi:hypothetical protein
VYVVFAHTHPLIPFPHFLSHLTGTKPPDRTCTALLFANIEKGKNDMGFFFFVSDRYTGSFLVTFPCIYVL